jgi:hypothetical protein
MKRTPNGIYRDLGFTTSREPFRYRELARPEDVLAESECNASARTTAPP